MQSFNIKLDEGFVNNYYKNKSYKRIDYEDIVQKPKRLFFDR